MKALILNSGTGSRMGNITNGHPKCMIDLSKKETILSRQLRIICESGIDDVIITTGPFEKDLIKYCNELNYPLKIQFVNNPCYTSTNYIYSIYLAREYLHSDIILMHGDLVFDETVFYDLLAEKCSCMTVSSTAALPEKDFKAVCKNGIIQKVGIEYFNSAVTAQPLYKLEELEWMKWLDEIIKYCESGNDDQKKCYAEIALNEIQNKNLYPFDIQNRLCSEIDTTDDLRDVNEKLSDLSERTVYMCFSADIIHSGHISIIKKAAKLGKLTVGVLSDEAVISYKRFPILPFEERTAIFRNLNGVHKVVEQSRLSYRKNLEMFRPDIVVHGDDWRDGFQKPIRDEVISILETYGGKLVEYPYSDDEKYRELEVRARADMSMPDIRRSRLKKLLSMKRIVTAIETHSGLTGLIAENTVIYQDNNARQFDAMWISSLCDSTTKGKPDIELVDISSRLHTINDIMEVTTKPIIFDGDTGGPAEHFVYTVRTLERMGVSMIIIEDKTGLKKNSLFGNEVPQLQEDTSVFCDKISAGKKAQKTSEFMICARIESLILEKGIDDALSRAFSYTLAGADAIMVHSRKKTPDEVFDFADAFRKKDIKTPIIVVPTAYSSVTEEELAKHGINVVIYANQLTRTGFPAMQTAAKTILENHRALECDEICMPFEEIIRLIPGEM